MLTILEDRGTIQLEAGRLGVLILLCVAHIGRCRVLCKGRFFGGLAYPSRSLLSEGAVQLPNEHCAQRRSSARTSHKRIKMRRAEQLQNYWAVNSRAGANYVGPLPLCSRGHGSAGVVGFRDAPPATQSPNPFLITATPHCGCKASKLLPYFSSIFNSLSASSIICHNHRTRRNGHASQCPDRQP